MTYAKAIVALIVPVIMTPLIALGIAPDTSVENALSILLMAAFTALSVYLVPNKQ